MSLPKFLIAFAVCLFTSIGILAFFKGGKATAAVAKPIEVELGRELRIAVAEKKTAVIPQHKAHKVESIKEEKKEEAEEKLPDANRVSQLFNKEGAKLPIVETITYKKNVHWHEGRPAWLSDYASHYHTSRHFIARSLNGKPDYFKQDLAEGDRFNVLRLDKKIEFYLLVDLSRCRLWLYYDDLDLHERTLLKSYKVCLGRVEPSRGSGYLTPLGKYTLGNKVTTYKPRTMGHYKSKATEMITVFGTRWIPFDKEVENCTAPAKGYGIHGVPWVVDAHGERVEERSSLGKYESDGCIRMASEDVEEVFAIIISKPAKVELVKDFFEAKLPSYIKLVK